MLRLKLSDADRSRFGCPEWIEYDPSQLSNREAIALAEFGYPDPLRDLGDAWRAQLDKDGDGGMRLVRVDYRAWTSVVWLALRRSGAANVPPLSEFDFDVTAVEVSAGPDVNDAGKEPAPNSAN